MSQDKQVEHNCNRTIENAVDGDCFVKFGGNFIHIMVCPESFLFLLSRIQKLEQQHDELLAKEAILYDGYKVYTCLKDEGISPAMVSSVLDTVVKLQKAIESVEKV